MPRSATAFALSVLVVGLLLPCAVLAQAGPQPTAAGPTQQTAEPAPSPAFIQTQLARVKEAPDVSEQERQALAASYESALQELTQADEFRRQADDFDARRREAPALLKQLQDKLAAPAEEVRVKVPADAGVTEVSQRAAAAEAALAAARNQVADLEAEPRRRADRRAEVPARLAEADQELSEVREELAAQAPGDLSDETQARRVLLETREERLEQETRALQSEIASYDARRELLTARTDMAARDLRNAEETARQWRQALAAARRREADSMVARTAGEAGAVHPAAAGLAAGNEELAGLLSGPTGLTARVQQADAALRSAVDDLEKWTTDFAGMRARIDSVGVTKALGALLRKKLLDLPDVREDKRAMRRRQDLIADVQLDLIDSEEKRAALSDLDAAVDRELRELPGVAAGADRAAVQADVRLLLQTRRDLLDLLIRDQNDLFSTLVEVNARREQFVRLIENYRRYIEEKVLWFRSSAPLGPSDLESVARSLRRLLSPSGWLSAVRSLGADGAASPVLYVAVVVLVLWLSAKGRFRKRLSEVGELTRPAETDSFRLTLEALALTSAAALPGPLLVWFIGWRVAEPIHAPAFARMVGAALRGIVPLYVTMSALRLMCQRGGLAEAHFRWPEQSSRTVRAHLRWLVPVVLPTAFLYYEAVWVEGTDQALAALTLVVILVSLAVFMARVLHPAQGVPAPVIGRHPGGWTDRLRYVWHTALVGLPLVLAVATVAGYQYTARALAERLLATIWLGLAMLLFFSLLLRWLFVARRRLALERIRKRREEAGQEEAGEGEPTLPPEPEVSISTISHQMRSLVESLSALLLIVGLWLVWRDVLPALGFFSAWPVWHNVTLGNVGRALIVVLITYVAARNIPGLLEITVLQRLPLEGGVRFAISTISRYIISIVGIILAFQAIGIGWDKVQWLAAAVTVGLGFGLQEIFANFVSGLIVLLERPIRVGDTVTVGDTTGTVTRIRMRATTITDWDRKELVVPNKEFVTGRLVNWTLSDRILRLIVRVGIAYGSDTETARRLLLDVARRHREVLADPAPVALFMDFGESSLDFELRVFLPSIEAMFQTTSDLHYAIDQAFRKAGIEIAFPQRDVHVRSIRAPLRVEDDEEDRSATSES